MNLIELHILQSVPVSCLNRGGMVDTHLFQRGHGLDRPWSTD